MGTKSDDEVGRTVSFKEGEEKAKSYNVRFFETSAAGGANVNEAFLFLIRELISQ